MVAVNTKVCDDMSMELTRRIEAKRNACAKSELPQFPPSVMVEATNACQYGCTFCAHRLLNPKVCFLPVTTGQAFLQEAFDNGAREVAFNGCGEQFLHADIAKFIGSAKTIGYTYIYATSNGASPVERYMAALDAGLDSIKFSFNATNASEYARIHNVSEKQFAVAVDTIRTVARAAKQRHSPCKVYISCVCDIPSLAIHNTIVALFPDDIDEIVLYKKHNLMGQVITNTEPPLGNSVCVMLFNFMRLTASGHINACCVDFANYLAVAKYQQRQLAAIWESDAYRNLRRQALNKQFGNILCKRCYENIPVAVSPLNKEFALADVNVALGA